MSMNFTVEEATIKQKKLRAVFEGPSGSGKTYSALRVARSIVGPEGKIYVIDTERGSSHNYGSIPEVAGSFKVVRVDDNYDPSILIQAIRFVEAQGADFVIVDSLTHFWNGPNGFLEMHDKEVKRMQARGLKPDGFAAWKIIDPVYRRWIQDILATKPHFIGTLRAKTEYDKTTDEKGKTSVKKVGMAPEMRSQFEYEFDLEAMLNMDNTLVIGKNRVRGLSPGDYFEKPGPEFGAILRNWLEAGAPPDEAIDLTKTPPPTDPPPGEEVTAVIPKVNVFQAIKLQLESAVGNPDALKEAQQAAIKAQSEKMITQAEYSELGKVYLKVKNGAA